MPNMAPIKRKGTAAEESASSKPQKRARVGADEKKRDRSKQDGKASGKEVSKEPLRSASSVQKDSDLSVVRDEEPSFPRGGGSVLTPLERKQIQIQATRDVLFEQKGSGKAVDDLKDGDSQADIEMNDEDKEVPKTKKARKAKGKKRDDHETSDKQGVRIEGLSFKVRIPDPEAYILS
jgi:rRNA biogenesis protein RRP5